jgi:hypothetical protein
MPETNLFAKLRCSAIGQKPFKKGWSCPSDETLAAYVEQALEESLKAELQDHLAGCDYCRGSVADIVTLQRETELPRVPEGLIQRVRVLAPSVPKRWPWGWATVATAGTLACAVIVGMVLNAPQTLKIPEGPPPAVPITAEGATPIPTAPPVNETVRELKSPESFPTIIFPRADKVIARDRLDFRWSGVPDVLYYQVRILSLDGDLVWQADSTTTHIETSHTLALAAGRYFVLVSAVMKSGKTRKSNPVGFQVSDSN